MSKTYRRTLKGHKSDWVPRIYYDELRDEYWTYRDDRNPSEWLAKNPHRARDVENDLMGSDYGTNHPSHWNHDFHTVPARAKNRNLLKKIFKEELDPDDTVFYDYKKPVIYYW